MNPDYAHWYGWAQMNLQLEKIKGENRTLRRLAALEKAERSTPGFEAAAGLMALAVLAVFMLRKKR